MSSEQHSAPGDRHASHAVAAPVYNYTDSTEQTEILTLIEEVIGLFARHFVLVLAVASIVASAVFFAVKSRYVPLYRAQETYIVTPNYSVNYNLANYNTAVLRQITKSFPYVINNDAMQALITEDLGTAEMPGTVRADSVEETNAFTITVSANDPETARKLLNSVIRNYPAVARDVIGDTTITLMGSGGVPYGPVNGDAARRSAARSLLVVAAAFAVIFVILSKMKKTVRSEDDFRTLLNVKCLASIPKVRLRRLQQRGGKKGVIRIDDKRVNYGFKEAVRTLRTRVERQKSDSGARIFLVSSAIAGEGKSTVAANLALSLAMKGAKTLLIDMDLRNSSSMQTLGLSPQPHGVIDVLERKKTLTEVILRDKKSGLMLLPAGRSESSIQSLLNSPYLKPMFLGCGELADYIIVDTPPSSILADASNLADYADQGIFVVRQDYAPLSRVTDGLDMLYDTGLPLTGCVLNATSGGVLTSYRYGYGYGRYGKYGKYGKYGRGRTADGEG